MSLALETTSHHPCVPICALVLTVDFQDLHNSLAKAAHGGLRRALHEHKEFVVVDKVLNLLLHLWCQRITPGHRRQQLWLPVRMGV